MLPLDIDPKTLHEIPNPRGKVRRRCFQSQSPSCGANFSNNISITQVRVNERKNNLTRSLKALSINFPLA